MRKSGDEYKLPNGEIVGVSLSEKPPQGARIWNGYDYENQYWVYNGVRDTRTLEELRAAIEAKRGFMDECNEDDISCSIHTNHGNKCPACGRQTLKKEEVQNALSRYCGKYICSDCGMREAFEGDFWHGNALHGAIRQGAE